MGEGRNGGEKWWGEKEAYEVSRQENMLTQSKVDLRVGFWSCEFCMYFEGISNEIADRPGMSFEEKFELLSRKVGYWIE